LVEGLGKPFAAARFAPAAFGSSFATFFPDFLAAVFFIAALAAALVCFLRVAIVVPLAFPSLSGILATVMPAQAGIQ